MTQNLIFYTIAGFIVGAVLQWAGMDMISVFVGSMLLPPIFLIAWRVAQYKNWV